MTTPQDLMKIKLANLNSSQQDDSPEKLVVEEKFQEYKSARSAMRLITTGGIRITFTNFKLLTQNPDVIEYLDKEIKSGLQGVTKGELLTLDEVNPMATLRREIEQEVRAKLIQEAADKAAGVSKDMGSTEFKANISPANSDNVAK